MTQPRQDAPNLEWTWNLPDRLKIAIADAVVIFSRIENTCIEIIWEIEHADLQRKKAVARARNKENIKILKEEFSKIPGGKTDKLWIIFDRLSQQRNLIVHGVWAWTNDKRPMLVSHAKFLEEEGMIGVEVVEWAWFDGFMKHANLLLTTLENVQRQLVGLADGLAVRRDWPPRFRE